MSYFTMKTNWKNFTHDRLQFPGHSLLDSGFCYTFCYTFHFVWRIFEHELAADLSKMQTGSSQGYEDQGRFSFMFL